MKGRLALALALAGLPLLQAAASLAFIKSPPLAGPGRRYDLIAVFGGDPARTREGLRLARAGMADALVVSDASPAELALALRLWGGAGGARLLYEPEARSTEENARLVAELMRREGMDSVVLLSSWFHLPRAWLLMRLSLLGSGAELRVHPAEAAPGGAWLRPEFRRELLKLWGSLAQRLSWRFFKGN